ncbi:MAG: tyrosine-type recombinase/integrase [Lachnospiraceae bacterium]|nr:tyrosine-type recombinase/integrase [Lachnospiraceae bacterium]
MAGTTQHIAPIKSQEQLKAVAYELGNFGTTYKALFLLSLETGLWFHELREMKVADLKGKASVKSVRHGKEYTFSLSRTLRQTINKLCEGRNDDDYIFVGARTGKPLAQQSYINCLDRASEICGIVPAINMKSITRTFVYNLYLKDTALAMDYAKKPTVKKMYSYLKLDTPVNKENLIALHSTKSNFIKYQSSQSVSKVKRKVLEAFSEIEKAGKDIENADPAFLSKARKYLGDIESLTNAFMSEPTTVSMDA